MNYSEPLQTRPQTKLYLLTTVSIKDGLLQSSRCIGSFESIAQFTNWYLNLGMEKIGLHEAYYTHAVFEVFNVGIYPSCIHEDWFHYNTSAEIWLSCDKPESIKKFSGFGIG